MRSPRGAEAESVEVRLRHVEEFASELLISQNQYWGRHRAEFEDEPVATLDDLEWADGVAFGTPTRFGNVAAQLKQFMDQAGRLWQEGKLADRVATSLHRVDDGARRTGVDDPRAQQHPLPLGMHILPLGYTVSEVFAAGGNPYGTSFTSGKSVEGPDAKALAAARYQGQRLARYAAVIAEAREDEAFRVRRPRPERFHAVALG